MPSATAARERHAVALLYIYLREASALSVLLRWALPEPLCMERTTGNRLSRFFIFQPYANAVSPEAI